MSDARTTQQLLRDYAAILAELRRRGVVRTNNAPAGDLAETIVAAVYGGSLAPNSEKSWDVLADDGRRVQVKARVVTSSTRPVQFSVFRSWDFDLAVFVTLDAATYSIGAAIEVPVDAVRGRAQVVGWVSASRITVSMAVLALLPGARDITADAVRSLGALS